MSAVDWLSQERHHLVGIFVVFCFAVSGLLFWRNWKRGISWPWFTAGLTFTVILAYFVAPLLADEIVRPSPAVYLSGGLLVGSLVGIAKKRLVPHVLAAFSLGVFFFFVADYDTWSRWSTPEYVREINGYASRYREQALELFLESMGSQTKTGELLPAGTMHHPYYEKRGTEFWLKGAIEVEPKATWHTWFTGLYDVEKWPVEIWTPGGTLTEAAAGLEVRRRPG